MVMSSLAVTAALGTLGGAIGTTASEETEASAYKQIGSRIRISTTTKPNTTVVPEICNECLNGGTCTGNSQSFTCACVSGYEGIRCETDIDDCDPNPCLNSGVCEDGINIYTCTCPEGYTGDICQTNIDDCDPNPCLNGGVCEDGINDYTCTCPEGYTGDICQTVLPPSCDINNGGCDHNCHPTYDGTGRYCSCNTGYDLKLDEMACDLICKTQNFPILTIRCVTYELAPSGSNWDGAVQGCENSGLKLFKIRDAEAANCILQYLQMNHPTLGDIWIGLRDSVGNAANPAYYDWVADGSDLTGYQNWAPGQPNDNSPWAAQRCVQLWKGSGYRWDNDDCYKGKRYFCETGINHDDTDTEDTETETTK
ncbi:uncharacterized protein LOC102808514 [Saccoglossus kowalevskii]